MAFDLTHPTGGSSKQGESPDSLLRTGAPSAAEKEFFTALGACGGKPGELQPLTANSAIYIQDKPQATKDATKLAKITGSQKVFCDIQYGLAKNYAGEVMDAMQSARANLDAAMKGPATGPNSVAATQQQSTQDHNARSAKLGAENSFKPSGFA